MSVVIVYASSLTCTGITAILYFPSIPSITNKSSTSGGIVTPDMFICLRAGLPLLSKAPTVILP